MKKNPSLQRHVIWITPALACLWLSPSALAQDESLQDSRQEEVQELPAQEEATLRFSFSGAPWRDVINWLAEESDLALHVGDLPPGSFTYSDPNAFTHQEAIARVNLFLLPQGYTLVRSGRLLSVINLGDPRGAQQLDAIAELLTTAQLADRNDYDVVKCIFPLGDIEAQEAVEELSVLKLMSTPQILAKTNQLIITDTVRKLQNVKAVLEAFRPDAMDNGTVVKSFALQHVDAEDILIVARPHLGLATGEMIGIDVSLSADLQGANIFVTGVEDKVKLLEGLVTAIDRPAQDASASDGDMELRSHSVGGGNVETVYNVLQTLLAGKTVRLSMDEAAGSVVALATRSVQEEIAQTVSQLQASEAEFAVIQLKTIDPYLAVGLLEEMLDLTELERRASASIEAISRGRGLDLGSGVDLDVPKIDADPVNMRLFIRAKPSRMEQIKKIVAELDANAGTGNADGFRMLPLRGEEAERVLDTAVKFWRGSNPVVLFRSWDDVQPEVKERVVSDDADDDRLTSFKVSASESRDERWLTSNNNNREPAIRCQLTPRGLLLQSDDTQALDQFESHLRTIAGPTDSTPSPPIVFYLKYTRADDALRMLAELLEGGESAMEGEYGSLVNGYLSSTNSLLGSFVTSRDGTTTMTAGSITVVADSRLNRLIAQGTASEMEQIEDYLQIIDKDNSITSIKTYGSSNVIELVNTKASEVAAAIRDAFAGRIAATTGPGGANPQGSPQDQAQREAASKGADGEKADSKKQASKKAAPQPAKTLEPKMTIAVHEPSNSLIVTAPDQLFKEVEKLARLIDTRNEQTIEVVTPVNGAVFESLLQQVMLGETPSARPRPTTATQLPRPSPPSVNTRIKNGR